MPIVSGLNSNTPDKGMLLLIAMLIKFGHLRGKNPSAIKHEPETMWLGFYLIAQATMKQITANKFLMEIYIHR